MQTISKLSAQIFEAYFKMAARKNFRLLTLSGLIFSVVCLAKSQGHHQPIEMKRCMGFYRSIPNAKFVSSSFSISGDMTSQNFPLEKGKSLALFDNTDR